MFLVEMMRKLLAQTRTCPKCGHRQPIKSGELRKERCEKCRVDKDFLDHIKVGSWVN